MSGRQLYVGGGFLNCRGKGFWGLLAIILGLVIILSLLLPSEFWWIVSAGALIWGGVCLMKRC